ncbi:host cell division inhibitor Icd-like protein [Escherichia coli]|uniref:host cell division inhibitor Icd-like protein n=1 Tax=Escherichia coli TaxID=562 RepID=UPI003AB9B520
MNIEKSRLISEAAPHLNAYQGTINGNEPAAQKEAFNLAGMLSKVDIYNLTKPDIDTAAPGVPLPVREALTLNKKMVSRAQEKLLKGYGFIWYDHLAEKSCYSPSVAAKSATGIGTPNTLRATQTPKASFFVSDHHAHQISGLARTVSMVALVGLRSRRPVSFVSGSSNPANVTATIKIGTLCGDSLNTKEAAIMATTPTQKPQFIWIIAAVRRDMPTITAKIHHIAAETEQEARRILARDHVCFFAGRIRTGGAHA